MQDEFSVTGQAVEKADDHVVQRNQNPSAKQCNEYQTGQFLYSLSLEKLGLLFHRANHHDQIHHDGKYRHGYHKPIKFTSHALHDVNPSAQVKEEEADRPFFIIPMQNTLILPGHPAPFSG